MARLIRGRMAGQTVTLHQWANDWFTIKENTTMVVSPTNIILDETEASAWRNNPSGMDREFALGEDGRFARRAR